MTIYRLQFDRSNFLAAEIWPDEIHQKLGDPFILGRTSTWTDIWVPLEVKFHDLSDRGKILTPPDITVWFTSDLVLNEKAYRKLQEPLAEYGEFLPLKCEGNPYWLLHVFRITGMEAVNEQRSQRTIDEADFITIESLTFNEEVVQDNLIFKSIYDEARTLFCNKPFTELISQTQLRGLKFTTDLVPGP